MKRSRRNLSALAASCVLASLGAHLAHAGGSPATSIAVHQTRATLPTLFDGGLLWTTGFDVGRLRYASSTGAVRTVRKVGSYHAEGGYAGGARVERVEASGRRAVLVEVGWDELADKMGDDGPHGSTAYVVDLQTRKRTVVETCPTLGTAAIDGSLLVTSGCATSDGSVRVRDLDRPELPARRLSDAAEHVDIAGRFVAWSAGPIISVHDLRDGTQRDIDTRDYRSATGETLSRPESARPGSWDVDADGGLAWKMSTGGAGSPFPEDVVVAPADGSHPRRIASGHFGALVLREGKIATVRTDNRPDGLAEVLVLPLGGGEREIARVGVAAPDGPSVDFDGRRVAYTAQGCWENRSVWTRALDAPGVHTVTVDRCPVRVGNPTTVDPKHRGLGLEVGCPELVPTRSRDKCVITISGRVAGHRLPKRTTTTTAPSGYSEWRLPRSVVKKRPRRVHAKITVKTRGGTTRGVRDVRIIYRDLDLG